MKIIRRCFAGLFGILLLGAVVFIAFAWYYRQSHRPALNEDWISIHPGVHYRAFEHTPTPGQSARVMAIRLDLKESEATVHYRPYSPEALSREHHYTLAPADFLLRKNPDTIALLNGARYEIDNFLDNLPGAKVTSLESVLVDGVLSHRHAHSYLIWWTRKGKVYVETRKPPPDPLPSEAWMGVGVQGLQIAGGLPQYQALSSLEKAYPRTFLGADPETNTLWLIAFEAIQGQEMIDAVVELGIPYGGQLDSGDSTNLILGPHLPGIQDYTGIRNLRPLAGYLAIVPVEKAENPPR